MALVLLPLVVMALAGRVVAGDLSAAALHHPDALIRSAGYPSEAHSVTTADGYVLRLDRIARPGARPVFLAHTLYTNAAVYLYQGKRKAIGFLLYEAGFDVWLGHYRGSFLSLNHTSLSSSNDDYWKFGWQENGALDNPAFIDYVHAATGQRVLYFGHSMGSTTFFSMGSDRPDALDKVEAAFICAPPVFLGHATEPVLLFGVPIANATQALTDRLHFHRRPESLLRRVAQTVCTKGIWLLDKLCLKLAGVGGDLVKYLPDLVAFFPAGGSLWQVLHYDQLANPKWPGFRKFNYGSAKANRAKYGSDSPPDFSLEHIQTPIYLYNGKADTTCTLQDLLLLKSKLPNVKQFFFSANPKFGHVDFVMSATADVDVYAQLLADMRPYQRS